MEQVNVQHILIYVSTGSLRSFLSASAYQPPETTVLLWRKGFITGRLEGARDGGGPRCP